MTFISFDLVLKKIYAFRLMELPESQNFLRFNRYIYYEPLVVTGQ
jgi:hypothetical protein